MSLPPVHETPPRGRERAAATLHVKLLREGAVAPGYQTDGAAGLDLVAAPPGGVVVIPPGHRALVPTGIAVAIPRGYEGQVRPRSGLAARHGVTVLNTPGTVDADYRGEVKVVLINLGQEEVRLSVGERIAQLVFCPVVRAEFQVVEALDGTERGEGGFGSTGT